MSELTARLNKLRHMSAGEISHRAREQAYLRFDRMHAGKAASSGIHSFKRYMSGAPSERFYGDQREDVGAALRKHNPQWIQRAVAEAERTCQHEFRLLGYPAVRLGSEIDWHRDPVTGQVWECRFWADYDPVHDSGGRDSKIVHELNRHQHLPRLAKAYRLTGDERYAAEAIAQLQSWIAQNPPGLGINWQSSLEIAIRAISWMWTIFPLLPSRSFDEAAARSIGEALFAQLEHVRRYTSRYSSPNTHLIGEAAALFVGGLIFSDQEQSARWLREGSALLAETAEKQVFDDGVYGELSSSYHCYALDFYLQAIVLARQNGYQLPEIVVSKARRMLEFVMHLTRPDGTLPALGDDDGGRALALQQRNYRSFQDGLCLGALLYHRGDFKYQAGGFHEEALWMLGKESRAQFARLQAVPPTETQSYHPMGGYLIQRSGWGPLDHHLVLDCGGLGIVTGGHAHADGLSLNLFGGGRELLGDSGTYCYNGAPETRRYFRSTRAHNTVAVDDRDQADQGGTFQWKTRFHTQAAVHGIHYFEAEHDGYGRLPQPVIHRRRVVRLHDDCWLIGDDFRGAGEHKFEFSYHMPTEGVRIGFFATEAAEVRESPGWVSRGYGDKEPSTVLRAELTSRVPMAAMTFLWTGRSEIRQLSLDSGDGIACSLERGGVEDIAVFSTGDSEMAMASLRMRGEFFWMRLEGGVVKQALAVRARSMHYGGTEIFRKTEPGFYFGRIGTESKEESLCAEFAES